MSTLAIGNQLMNTECRGHIFLALTSTKTDLIKRFGNEEAGQSEPFTFEDGVVLRVTKKGGLKWFLDQSAVLLDDAIQVAPKVVTGE